MTENSVKEPKRPIIYNDLIARNKTKPLKRMFSEKSSRSYPKSVIWILTKSYPGVFDGKKNGTGKTDHSSDWSIYRTENIRNGLKKYFQCNRVKLQGEELAPAMYLLYDATHEKVVRFCTTEDYYSEETGLSNEVKAEIEKLFNLNIKPSRVLESLTKMSSLPIPSTSQLNNYLHILRHDKSKTGKVNFGELLLYLNERSIISSNDHASFVVAHEVLQLPDQEDSIFRFFISTKYLLSMAMNSKVIQVSSSFNLIWQTYPLFILGTTDKVNKFHPFGLLVSSQGKLDDFRFLFRSFKNALETHYKSDTHPSYLLCNAEVEIQRAFREVFGFESVMLTCWTFARKNIIRLVLNLIGPDNRAEILSDIDTLQLAPSKEIFEKACGLFLRKWHHEAAFCKYFRNHWLERNQNWFEGAARGYSSTNNPLEEFCNEIKKSNLLRIRFTVEAFLTKALDMVSNWSSQYKSGRKKFARVPAITTKLWIDSYQWAKQPKNILKSGNKDNHSFYRVPAKENAVIERNIFWNSFDSYKEMYFNECHMALPLEKEGWCRGKCSCPMFLKSSICKHILGMAITLKEIKVPQEIRNERIGDSLSCDKAEKNGILRLPSKTVL